MEWISEKLVAFYLNVIIDQFLIKQSVNHVLLGEKKK